MLVLAVIVLLIPRLYLPAHDADGDHVLKEADLCATRKRAWSLDIGLVSA